MVAIVPASADRLASWAALRGALWPEDGIADHLRETAEALERPQDRAALLALDEAGAVVGFAEASLRRDYVNGCETSPVVFLEGIYVEERFRRAGVGRRLADAVAEWGRAKGCREFASDAAVDNAASRRFHAASGFEETETVVCFRRLLRD